MSGYIGSTPVPQATQHRESFTCTEGQTTFNTAGYTAQFVDVYLNGSHLSPADFTATNGSDVVLGVAASADDVCDIISYTPFEVAAQTFTGTTTMTGDVNVQGNLNVGTTTTLLTNGTFDTNTTGWTATTSSIAVSGAVLVLTPDSGVNGFCSQSFTTVVGRHYVATVTVTEDAGSLARLSIGTSSTGSQNGQIINLGVGTHSLNFIATATTHHFVLVVGGGSGQATKFDNARLTEASSVAFPVISGSTPLIKQGNSVNDLAINTNDIDRLLVTNDGYVLMPTQPAFSVNKNNTTQSDLATGDTAVTVIWAAERFDQNSDFDLTNNRFVAPVTGKYQLQCNIRLHQIDSAAAYNIITIKTSNLEYSFIFDPDFGQDQTYWSVTTSVLADMDADDTASVIFVQNSGAAQTDIEGANGYTYFTGYLVA